MKEQLLSPAGAIRVLQIGAGLSKILEKGGKRATRFISGHPADQIEVNESLPKRAWVMVLRHPESKMLVTIDLETNERTEKPVMFIERGLYLA